MGLLPLLVEAINLNPGDIGVVGFALEVASRLTSSTHQCLACLAHVTLLISFKGVSLHKWLVPDRLATLLRAMRDHSRQITIVEPALLLLTLLQNQGNFATPFLSDLLQPNSIVGYGATLIEAGALRVLANAGASFPKAWNKAEWDRASCVVVNTDILIDLLTKEGTFSLIPDSEGCLPRLLIRKSNSRPIPANSGEEHD